MYLVKVMNAVSLVMLGRVEWTQQTMVSLDEMKGWDFFDSRDEWAESFAAWDRQQNTKNQRPYAESGSSPGAK